MPGLTIGERRVAAQRRNGVLLAGLGASMPAKVFARRIAAGEALGAPGDLAEAVTAREEDEHRARIDVDDEGIELHPPMDARQLKLVESVHRGFLYQHLYAVGCLLRLRPAGADCVVVEHDEDVEVIFGDRHLYVQVKTRQNVLQWGDIQPALERVRLLQLEHEEDDDQATRHSSSRATYRQALALSRALVRLPGQLTSKFTIRRMSQWIFMGFFHTHGPTWRRPSRPAPSWPKRCRSQACLLRRWYSTALGAITSREPADGVISAIIEFLTAAAMRVQTELDEEPPDGHEQDTFAAGVGRAAVGITTEDSAALDGLIIVSLQWDLDPPKAADLLARLG